MKQAPKLTSAKRVAGHKSFSPGATINLLREGLKHSVYVNLGQQMIILTEDRLRLDLHEWSDSMKHRQRWHVPAAMLLTEMAAVVTSTFRDTLGISGQQWEALFQALILVTVLWLVAAVVRGWQASSADSLSEKLKAGQQRGDRTEAGNSTASS